MPDLLAWLDDLLRLGIRPELWVAFDGRVCLRLHGPDGIVSVEGANCTEALTAARARPLPLVEAIHQ